MNKLVNGAESWLMNQNSTLEATQAPDAELPAAACRKAPTAMAVGGEAVIPEMNSQSDVANSLSNGTP